MWRKTSRTLNSPSLKKLFGGSRPHPTPITIRGLSSLDLRRGLPASRTLRRLHPALASKPRRPVSKPGHATSAPAAEGSSGPWWPGLRGAIYSDSPSQHSRRCITAGECKGVARPRWNPQPVEPRASDSQSGRSSGHDGRGRRFSKRQSQCGGLCQRRAVVTGQCSGGWAGSLVPQGRTAARRGWCGGAGGRSGRHARVGPRDRAGGDRFLSSISSSAVQCGK